MCRCSAPGTRPNGATLIQHRCGREEPLGSCHATLPILVTRQSSAPSEISHKKLRIGLCASELSPRRLPFSGFSSASYLSMDNKHHSVPEATAS